MTELNAVKVCEAAAKGLSVYCASCKKYWRAREQGLPGDQCLCVEKCGSPIAGDDFHEYDGPITDYMRFCFVCGASTPRYGVGVEGKKKIVGVCVNHVRMIEALEPLDTTLPPIGGKFVHTPGLGVMPAKRLLKRKMTLFERIAQEELELEKEEEDKRNKC